MKEGKVSEEDKKYYSHYKKYIIKLSGKQKNLLITGEYGLLIINQKPCGT
jgi:hypothetical protein